MAARKKNSRQTRQRGQIQSKGPNKWLVRVYLGTDPETQRRRYSSRMVEGTKKEAQKIRTKMLSEIDSGTFVEPAKQPLREYLAEWLEVKTDITPRTRMDYGSHFKRYVYPVLGNRALGEVNTMEVQKLYNGMQKRGLSPNTIRLVHAPLKQAFGYAVKRKMITNNPAEYTHRPSLRRVEREVLTPEQVNRFLEVAQGDKWHALWCILLYAGLRPGEALALKWEDLEGNTLRVRRAMKKVGPGKYEEGEPKTAKGRRNVTLIQEALDALSEHRVKENRRILKSGSKYKRRDYIFSNAVGAPLDPARVSRRWKKLLKEADLPPLRLYDARHTCATILIMLRVPVKVVSEILGHASVGITLDTYTHVHPEQHEDAAAKLSAAMNRTRQAS